MSDNKEMVKIHDGSLVPASELITGRVEDDEGNEIKFEQVKDVTLPTWKAERNMDDGTNRKRVYQFSIEDTNVTVHMNTVEPEQGEEGAAGGAKTEKAYKETPSPTSTASTTEAKKNSSLSGDYQVKKHL